MINSHYSHKKTVGLLTFHDTNNFGSYLQTYALYKAIEELGYDCEIINYQCSSILAREDYGNFIVSCNPKSIIKQILFNGPKRKKYKNLKNWLRQNTRIGRDCLKPDLCKLNDKYDIFIVGSDIVWGLDITLNDYSFFLDFVSDDKKKYSFASSVGNAWKGCDVVTIKHLLSRFEEVAVREESAAKLIESLGITKPEVVCDPTLLLSMNEWKEMGTKEIKKKYVLVYFPTNEAIIEAKKYSKVHNINCVVINYGLPIRGCKSVRCTSINEFLSLFLNASFVCTGSYHGMLFSLNFQKDFAFFNRAHASRMNDLAKLLNLGDRDGTQYPVSQMKEIDYGLIISILHEYRNKSISILERMLKV